MSGPVRIRIDRLVLEGLAQGVGPAEIETAVRDALRRQLASVEPRAPRRIGEVRTTATGSAAAIGEAAAGAVTRAVRGGR